MNQNTNVNLIPKFPFSGNLYFSQYDVGRVATINLVEDGSAYTIPSGATVKIQATKPSGLGFSVECTYSGNVVTVVSTETMTNEYGRFPCELRIESGDVLLGTTNFTFNVEKSPHPTNTVDGDSGDIINQITVALNNALSDINDAKEEAIEEISQSGGGITEAVKQALLNCFAHVAWIDDQGQTYYDALYDALYDVPAPTLVSISAVYTQSGTVYDTDTLDSLKSDLVVTATYDDSSTATVPSADYTLSGTLAEGTSTITVSYGGKTTTFDVTVTRGVDYTLDAFDDATWEVGKDYNRTTGAYGDATNQVATDKFTVQDCLYQLTGSGATYPGIFAWDEQGNYQGRFESSNFADFPVLGLPSKFTYAFHVYDSNGTFVPSNAHYMPINNSANQTAQISIRLSDHLEEFTWQSGYGQVDITNILAEYGINASNLNSKINRTSEITFIGGASNLSFTNSNGIVIYNISPYQGSVYLIPRTTTATNLTNLKAFISENDPVFIINGEV